MGFLITFVAVREVVVRGNVDGVVDGDVAAERRRRVVPPDALGARGGPVNPRIDGAAEHRVRHRRRPGRVDETDRASVGHGGAGVRRRVAAGGQGHYHVRE